MTRKWAVYFKFECIDERGISSIAVSSGAAYLINPDGLPVHNLVSYAIASWRGMGLPLSGLPLGLHYGIPNSLYFCVKITKKKKPE